MKTFFTIFTFVFLSLNVAFAAQNGTVKDIKVLSETSIQVTLDWVNALSEPLSWDLKVLKDLSVASAQKSTTNEKVVSITLSSSLLPETSYSLLSVFGAEGNMDFVTKKEFANAEFPNTDSQNTSIEKIVLKDAKTIEVYYKLAIKSEELDYKILSNLWVNSMQVNPNDSKTMILTLQNKLEQNLNYILMLISFKDGSGNEIDFSEWIVDFKSGEFSLLPSLPVTNNTGTLATTNLPELNAAALIGESTPESQVEQKLVEEVAGQVSETPHTGPETWFVILGTLLMATFLTFARKKIS
jgi:hypothetical protein